MPELTFEERQKLTELIRSKLTDNALPQRWLIVQLGSVGIVTDKSEMSSILAGTRIGAKVDEVIRRSLDILSDYENVKDGFGNE